MELRDRTRNNLIIAIVLCITAALGFTASAFADMNRELRKISEEREKSVGYAKIAKTTLKKQPKKLTQAMLYYTDARSIGNPIIQNLQTSLTSRNMKEAQLREMLTEDMKRLVTANEKFRAFIEGGGTVHRALPALAAVAGIASSITDSCIKFWKEYKDADKKQVDEMVRALDGYKWDDWEKL